jgi:diaminopimelate epimerase
MFIFYKMHGLGNDFVIIDQRNQQLSLSTDDIKLICHRKYGVGCDQLIVIKNYPQHDCEIAIFNNDGSHAGACGNATRCVAMLLKKNICLIKVGDRSLMAKITESGDIAVDMGIPEFINKQPMAFDIAGFEHQGIVVDVGNPHLVFFVENLTAVDLAYLGPIFENHQYFPERINVSFATIAEDNQINLRTWERGAGITQACGTAACAAFAAATKQNKIDDKSNIIMEGGSLQCSWSNDGTIIMQGPACLVYQGEWLIA